MPKSILFKRLDQKVNLNIEIIRYPTSNSESGAYIFAPKDEGVPLRLQVIDATILTGDDQDRIIIFYKSRYSASVQALLSISINKLLDQRVLKMSLLCNQIKNNELFLRFSVDPHDQEQFYVHDSVNHVRKGHIKKRVMTSRDLGAHFHSVVSGASL